jgi:hypothetical protein
MTAGDVLRFRRRRDDGRRGDTDGGCCKYGFADVVHSCPPLAEAPVPLLGTLTP